MKRSMWGALVCLISVVAVILSGCSNSASPSVTFPSGTTQAVDNGQTLTITAKVNNDSSNKGVTWSLTSGPGTLSNVTTTSVTYNAPAIGAVARSAAQPPTSQTAIITAKSNADPSKSGTVTINLTPPPSMSNQTLAAGTEGNAYSQPVAETGGAGTLSWQIITQPGPQPAGLTINTGTGVISGTPTGPNGTFTFTVKVTDSNAGAGGPQSAQAQVTITINLPPAPKISPAGSVLPPGTEGATYSPQTLSVNGGLANFTWAVIGSLPAGLTGAQSTDTKSFTISGKPTGPTGTSNFQIKVTDSSNPTQSDTQSYSITINLPAPPKINPAGGALAAGTEGTPYGQPALTVNGGLANFTWTVVGGDASLPTGLHSMQSAGGATFTISGTPTGPNGTTNFQIKVTDSSNPPQSDTENYSILINLPQAPKINPAGSALAAGTEGTAYAQPPLTVNGGLGNFTWTVVGGDVNLPAGLHSAQSGTNNNTFTISGTPTGPNGTTNFQIKVTDSSNPPQSDTENYSILINLPQAPQISPASGALPNGNVGTPASNLQFTVSGGLGPTFTWSETGTLPTGLTFNANNSTGNTVAITGTPTTAQNNVPFSVTVMDSSNPKQSKTNNYTLTINPPAPFMISTTTLPTGNFQQQYNATISATGGIAPYAFNLDATSAQLPANLTFTQFTDQQGVHGQISGVPQTAGTFSGIIVDAHDSQATPANDQKTYTLMIAAPTLVFTPPNNTSLPTGTQNQVYPGATISATGGVQPYTFTQDATSQLPTGMMFTQGTNQATITGTPTQTGTFNVVVDFQDSEHPAVTQKLTYTLTVNASGGLTCPLPAGGAENLLTGTYSGLFNAWEDATSSTMFEAAAAFKADGKGGIAAGGEADAGDITAKMPPTLQTMTPGCYSISSTDHRGKMIWNFGPGNNVTFSFAVTADGSFGRFIEFDDTTPSPMNGNSRGSGFFKKQVGNPFTTVPLGPFGFSNIGSDVNGNRVGVLGRFDFVNGATQIQNGFVSVAIANTNGTPTLLTDLPFTGTITSPPDAFGRGTFTLTINIPGLGQLVLRFAFYIQSTGEIYIQSIDVPDSAGHALQNGRVLAQSGTTFTTSSFTGNAIFSLTGEDPSANHAFTNLAMGQLSSPTGNGVVTTVIDEVSNGNVVNNDATISGGSLTITANEHGMGTLTIGSGGTARPFLIVMISQNTGFMIEGNTSPSNILSGGFEDQTSTTEPSGLFVGGSVFPGSTNASDQVGTFNISGATLNGTEDQSSTSGLSSNKVTMLNVTGPDSHGRLTLSQTGKTGSAPAWIVSSTRVIVAAGGVGGTDLNPVFIFLDQ